jgi:hypothetical protein
MLLPLLLRQLWPWLLLLLICLLLLLLLLLLMAALPAALFLLRRIAATAHLTAGRTTRGANCSVAASSPAA